MHGSSSEALAQLVRLGREGLSLLSLAAGLHDNPFPSKNGGALRLTPPGAGVRDGGEMMEGTLFSIQMLLQRRKGPRVWVCP